MYSFIPSYTCTPCTCVLVYLCTHVLVFSCTRVLVNSYTRALIYSCTNVCTRVQVCCIHGIHDKTYVCTHVCYTCTRACYIHAKHTKIRGRTTNWVYWWYQVRNFIKCLILIGLLVAYNAYCFTRFYCIFYINENMAHLIWLLLLSFINIAYTKI